MVVKNKSKTTLPAIPRVTVSDPNLQNFCNTVTQFCAIHSGNVGSGLDRAVTARELVDSGFATWKQTRPSVPGGSGGNGGGSLKPVDPDIPDVVDPPVPVKGFKVISGTVAILLIWDDATFEGRSSTQIWRHTTNEFSSATKIADTPASVYSDIPEDNSEYFYWIRHTNVNGDLGPISDWKKGQAGLLTSNPDGDTMLVSDLVAYAIYATELTSVHIKGGDIDIAGGAFVVDEVGNLTMTRGSLSIADRFSVSTTGEVSIKATKDGNVGLNMTSERLDVYDIGGVLRVRIGKLT